MSCNDFSIMIHEYFDNELPEGKEPLLFTHIAQCEECRNDFKTFNIMHSELLNSQAEFPVSLEKRIFDTIKQKESNKFNQTPALNPMPLGISHNAVHRQVSVRFIYALTLALVIFSIFFVYQFRELKSEVAVYKNKFESTAEQVNIQEQQINSLINGMPSVKVKAAVDNPNIIKDGI